MLQVSSEMPALLLARYGGGGDDARRSSRSLFPGSKARSHDLKPARDDFHVIGADVVPVPFSIFGSPLLDGGNGGAECPSPQAANYSSELR